MKRLLLLSLCLLTAALCAAQTQQGYVKTKGRMAGGTLIPGQGLSGALVSVRGRAMVLVDNEDGAFSFPVQDRQFQIDSVKKKGYSLVDADACRRTYSYSGNPVFFVMETPDRQLQDKLTAERKIRRTLQKQLQEKEDEIEALKAEQKISEEEYRRSLQQLYQEQESNEQLIKDMARRYSELDYDQLDDFYREVSSCIENGELVKADSLLRTKGDVAAQIEEQLQKGQALKEQEELLSQARAVHDADNAELARRCMSYHEYYATLHRNGEAAHYLEMRASLDPANQEWQADAGAFLRDYMADYDKALEYFQRTSGATALYNMGIVYWMKADYDNALKYQEAALAARKAELGMNAPETAQSYNDLGILYYENADLESAGDCFRTALSIRQALFGDEHPDVAESYLNLGHVCAMQGDPDKAGEYFQRSTAIRESVLGKNHPDVAHCYSSLGNACYDSGDFDGALDYCRKALDIFRDAYGENHPDVAEVYGNMGSVYREKGDLDKALEYAGKALDIRESVIGHDSPAVAASCSNLGNIYCDLGDLDKAMEYHRSALAIRTALFGELHPDVAECYGNIGNVYLEKGDFKNALSSYQTAVRIDEKTLGPKHPFTLDDKEMVKTIKSLQK